MRRTYDRDRYMQRVEMIREHVPDCAITTDIIVGFPGETEEDFRETLEVVDEVGYDSAFTFIFSPRRGTEAATLPGPAPARRSSASGWSGWSSSSSAARWSAPAASSARRRRCWSRARAAPTPRRLRGRTRHNKTVNFTGLGAAGRAGRGRDHRRDLDDAGGRGVAASRASLTRCAVVAIFGPTGVGKTEVAIELADLLRARGERPGRRVGRRDPGLRGPRRARRPSRRRAARAARAPAGLVRADRPASSASAEFAERAHAEIDALLDEGATPIVVGGTGLYLRAALTELDLQPPPDAGPARAARARAGRARARRRCTRGCSPRRRPRVHPERPQADRAGARAGAMGEQPHRDAPISSGRRSCGARRRCSGSSMDRDALAARIADARRRDARRAARSRRSSRRSSAAPRAPRARRSASRRSPPTCAGEVDADGDARSGSSAATRQYVEAPADLDAQARRRRGDRPHRRSSAARGRAARIAGALPRLAAPRP